MTGDTLTPARGAGLVTRRIEARKGWGIDWRELLLYRDLFRFLVERDLKVLYKQTVLGFGWAILRPLLSMLIFTIVFGVLAGVPSDGVPYPVFALAALVPWTYFSSATSDSTTSLVGNTNLLTKVYFPRILIPLTPVAARLVDFLIAFVVLLVLMAAWGIMPTVTALAVPLLVVLMFLTGAGIGLWLSALAVRYRDVRHASPFVIQILMYAAPVVWPSSLIRDRFGDGAMWLYGIYPMAGVIEGFRSALLGTTSFPLELLISGTLSSLVIFSSGVIFFQKVERTFADVA